MFEGLKARDLPGDLRRDLRALYRFYVDEERRAQLAAMGRVRRAFKVVSWIFRSLLAKLTPGRRLALATALIFTVLGRTGLGDTGMTTDLRLWAAGILVVVLMLELKDKLLARDEIEVARQVQIALLPSGHPQPPGFSLWSSMQPANDVGADLVDYIDLPDGRLGVVLGDVAGKGLGAALLTAKLQATLRALVPGSASLSDLGDRVNAILHRDGIDNRFVTLFYFEVRPGDGRLRYLNAGHNPPLVLRRDRIDTLDPESIPLGMMPEAGCREGAADLAPGDMLIAYSDGLTEARDARDEEFGVERLRAVASTLRGLGAAEAAARIGAAVDAFLKGERPHDDLSLVVLARTS
jgi:sigma-B regulation protein RsbU (phosphoserine phosphatase)